MSEEASLHPEHDEESRRLKQVISYLWGEIDRVKAVPPTYALKDELHRRHQHLSERQKLYAKSIPAPYFGRFDFQAEDDDMLEEFYVSKELDYGTIPHTIAKVVSWRAPIADVFYDRRGEVSYTSPEGQIEGAVFLRRQFDLNSGAINSIADTFDRRKKPSTVQAESTWVVDPDDYLRLVLEGKRGQGLTEVVTSIQQRQNQIMRADRQQILIVQGPAGSGKTTIALHRIAILLYPQDGQPIPKVMFIGANKFFLRFVKQVLPSLNISGVRQMTFADWAARVIGQQKIAQFRDLTRDEIFSSSIDDDRRKKLYERGKLKGSLKIADWLKNLAELYRVKVPQDGLAIYPTGLGSLGMFYDISADGMRQLLKDTENLPINRQRDAIVSRIADLLFEQHMRGYRAWMNRIAAFLNDPPEKIDPALVQRWEEQLVNYGYIKRETSFELGATSFAESRRKRALSGLRNEIFRLVSAEFPRISALEMYVELISGRDTLFRVVGLNDVQAALNQADDLIKRTAQDHPANQTVKQIKDIVAHLRERIPEVQTAKKRKGSLNDKNHPIPTEGEILKLYNRLFDMQRVFEEVDLLFDDKAAVSRLRAEDIAPVCYLHLLLEGLSSESDLISDHIIVDEAQDMSSLEMWLLRQFVSSGSMTILGDLAQSIHSYRGISSWDELQDVFEGDKVTYEQIDISYRSTYEIMGFANRILDGGTLRELKYPKAQPFPRHGSEVKVVPVADKDRLHQVIGSEVLRLESLFSTVAVICKTREECQEVYNYLPKGSATLMFEIPSNEEDSDYKTKTVVLPSFLAKGIEFDACIVANANHATYQPDELHGRLLYVATTRALHELVVLHLEEASRHLPVSQNASKQVKSSM